MAIKTAAEMFGDGGGGNPQVPLDTGNPPGYHADNRGVAFGEQVTSAIKNRTPYALVLNDEDLNTRLADFEVRGLDGAYDLGTVGPSGGGRQIIKDGGAIETVSALVLQHGDDLSNAHFRANLTGDTLGGGVGFDVALADSVPQTGVLVRNQLTYAGKTIWAPGATGTLNVGGGAPTQITLSGGAQFTDGAETDLLEGDLIEVSGSTSDDGLYRLDTISGQFTALLANLDGTAPSFTGTDACTATAYRAALATVDPGLTSGVDGVVVRGMPNTDGALTIVGGRASGVAQGAEYALRFRGVALDGTLLDPVSQFDSVGSWKYWGTVADVPGASLLNFRSAAIDIDRDVNSADGTMGMVSRPSNTKETDYSLLSLEQVWDLGTVARAFDFLGGTDEIQITGIVGSEDYLPVVGTVIEIVTPSAQAGFYRVSTKPGVDTYRLADFAGGTSLSLPNSGSGTCRMYSMNVIGRAMEWTQGVFSTTNSVGSVNNDVRTGALFSAGDGDGSTAVVCVAPGDGVGGNERFFIRGIKALADNGGEADAETFQVDSDGNIETMGLLAATGNIISGGNVYGGEFSHVSPISRTIILGARTGDAEADWSPSSIDSLTSGSANPDLFVDISDHLPTGATITAVYARVKPNGASAMTFRLYHLDETAWPAGDPTQTQLGTTQTTASNARQEMSVTGLTEILDRSSERVVAWLAGGQTGDRYYGLRIVFNDPGPRNH